MSRHAHPLDLTAEHPAVRVPSPADPATGPIDVARIPAPRGERRPRPPVEVPVSITQMGGHDGGRGNPLRRAEPKVRSASLAALLTPIVLFYAHAYVPGVELMPGPVLLAVDGLLTGLVVFLAGYLGRAVDRLDLWVVPGRPGETGVVSE